PMPATHPWPAECQMARTGQVSFSPQSGRIRGPYGREPPAAERADCHHPRAASTGKRSAADGKLKPPDELKPVSSGTEGIPDQERRPSRCHAPGPPAAGGYASLWPVIRAVPETR